ncbi:hypothetical protein B9L19_11390 [Geobacillus thermocatenulatus]|uniref:Uncharacterized protein n=1 Tax=Geobacillus thermocatenulatus TaxID=33938 RepID=A0A226Q1K6_9BACL|nr:hypothetical protein GT3921_12370 [Geobacillus thermocatenulatus]KLR72815.1 hypothetical protein ABH20_14585 [Geobacillus sp. T6]OXB86151.1 hypothetical protein B9L19_11390 [Geobacillus thermocatenulatus]RAN23299.1 hypothetical protein VC88_06680 [Geobacillus sp. A8]
MPIVHFRYTPFSNRIVMLNVIPLVLLAQLHREKRNCNTSPKGKHHRKHGKFIAEGLTAEESNWCNVAVAFLKQAAEIEKKRP